MIVPPPAIVAPNDDDILALAQSGDQEASLEWYRRQGERSPYFFSKVIAGYNELTPDLHQPVCHWLVDSEADRGRGLLFPRKYFKSSMVKGYVLRRIVANPEIRILFVGENDDVGAKNLADIQWKFREDKLFQALYPHVIPPDMGRDWPTSSLTLPRSRSYDEPTIQSVGIGTKHTGFHYNLIVYDDPIGLSAAGSPPEMKRAVDWFKAAPGLLDSAEAEELYVGTRWKHGKADLPGWIMENLPVRDIDGHKEGFKWIIRSAIEEGESIFPRQIAPSGKRIGYSLADLASMKKRQKTYLFNCFPAGSPILMADWTEKPIEQIEVGQEVIGFTSTPGRGSGKTGRRLAVSKVIAVGHRQRPVVKITTSVGRVIYCTHDHRWWTGYQRKESYKEYLPARIGAKIFSVYTPLQQPTPDQQRLWDWVGGMMDGEGSCSTGNVFIGQAQHANPEVCRGIETALDQLGISWYPNPKANSYHMRGGRSLIMALLNHARMYKRERFFKRLWSRSGQVTENGGTHRVKSIQYVGEQVVYNIQTTTGNYVAYGYATKNSNMMNNPTAGEDTDFPEEWIKTYRISEDRKALILSDTGERVEAASLIRLSVYDPSSGGASAEAENAIVVIGVDRRGRIFVLATWNKNCAFGRAIEQWHVLNDKWRCSANWYEAVGAHKEVGERLRERENPCKYCGKTHRALRGKAILPPPGNKEDRIRDLAQPAFEEGRVYLGEGMTVLSKQITDFPHSDMVDIFDALAYAISKARKPKVYDEDQGKADPQVRARRREPRCHTAYDPGGYS